MDGKEKAVGDGQGKRPDAGPADGGGSLAVASEEAGEYAYLCFELSKPIEYQGMSISRLDLTGLSRMTLDDLNGLYDTYAALGGVGMVMQESTLRFAQLAAASATGCPIEMIGRLAAKDAVALKNRVYRFFYR